MNLNNYKEELNTIKSIAQNGYKPNYLIIYFKIPTQTTPEHKPTIDNNNKYITLTDQTFKTRKKHPPSVNITTN